MARIWDAYLSTRDKAHLATGVWPAVGIGFGERPALVLIDNYYGVLGTGPKDLIEHAKQLRGAVGPEGWDAIYRTRELLLLCRDAGVPVVHITGLDGVSRRRGPDDAGRRQVPPDLQAMGKGLTDIVDELAPIEGELVLRKAAASAFFGTPLVAHLNSLDVDTIIACGESTSGCLRASVVDGSSYRFRMIVPEECAYDRHEACHAINLFDMSQKYADVLPVEEVKSWLRDWKASKAEATTADIITTTVEAALPPLKPVTIDPTDSALVIVDMQNVSQKPGGPYYKAERSQATIDHVAALLQRFRGAGSKVIHVQSVRALTSPEYTVFSQPRRLEEGTWAVEIVDELAPLPGEPVVVKRSNDCWNHTTMESVLASLDLVPGRSQIVITGCATNACVDCAVVGFGVRDYRVWIPVDCTIAMSEQDEMLGYLHYFGLGYDYNVIPTRSELISFEAVVVAPSDVRVAALAAV